MYQLHGAEYSDRKTYCLYGLTMIKCYDLQRHLTLFIANISTDKYAFNPMLMSNSIEIPMEQGSVVWNLNCIELKKFKLRFFIENKLKLIF